MRFREQVLILNYYLSVYIIPLTEIYQKLTCIFCRLIIFIHTHQHELYKRKAKKRTTTAQSENNSFISVIRKRNAI